MEWENWIAANKKQLEHIAGYEEQFVRTILAKMPEIEPQDVKAQFHFTDSNGKNRYIDFMIANKTKGYMLPIELDGYWKVQRYSEFDDMLKRQNDLVKIYGVLLRYTNKQMLSQPQVIIDEIRQTLHLQSTNQLSAKIVEEQNAKRFEEYQSQLAWYKEQLADQKTNGQQAENIKGQSSSTEDTITKDDIVRLKQTIDALQAKIEQPEIIKTPQVSKTKITLSNMIGIGAASLIVVALGANAFFNKSDDTKNIVTEPMALTSTYDSSNTDYPEDMTIIDNNSVDTSESLDESSDQVETLTTASAENNTATVTGPEEHAVIDAEETSYQEIESEPSYEPSPTTIPSSKANQYVGSYGVVCGDVVQVKGFNKGTYLNLGDTYPNQDATIVVWDSDASNFDNLDQYEGRSLCVKGTIDSYKGSPQIKLTSVSQLQ